MSLEFAAAVENIFSDSENLQISASKKVKDSAILPYKLFGIQKACIEDACQRAGK